MPYRGVYSTISAAAPRLPGQRQAASPSQRQSPASFHPRPCWYGLLWREPVPPSAPSPPSPSPFATVAFLVDRSPRFLLAALHGVLVALVLGRAPARTQLTYRFLASQPTETAPAPAPNKPHAPVDLPSTSASARLVAFPCREAQRRLARRAASGRTTTTMSTTATAAGICVRLLPLPGVLRGLVCGQWQRKQDRHQLTAGGPSTRGCVADVVLLGRATGSWRPRLITGWPATMPHAEGILGELCPRLCRLGEYSDLRGLGVEPGGQVLRTPFGFGS